MSGPTTATIKRLFAVSGNQCAFPSCNLPLVDLDTGMVLGEICHIKAKSEGSSRYDPNQTEKERHAFENLLLPCSSHHKIIDNNPEKHTVEQLDAMKRRHEAQPGAGQEATPVTGVHRRPRDSAPTGAPSQRALYCVPGRVYAPVAVGSG